MSSPTTREWGTAVSPTTLMRWARELVSPALRAAIAGLPAPERRVAGYHRGWHEADGSRPTDGADEGGKAVRPALTLLAAQAVGGPAECAVPGAVAVELVHDFSLLHDDVIDGDALRRHRPAAWAVYGTPAAVLTGDALLVCALRVLSGVPEPRGEAASKEMVEALADLMRGQSEDIAFEKAATVEAADYLAMAEGKTGALMGASCALGGVLAGASEQRVSDLRDFGRRLGVAYQCVDDLLGIWGESERSGKPVGADLAARKKSLPVVAALSAGGPAAERLASLYLGSEPLSESDIALAVTLIEESGGRERTELEAERQLAAAFRALSRARPVPEVYHRLHQVAWTLTHRDH
ncbi:polyprenyl synthetase family protein [Streptomyces sp. NPDC053755]|uniref:polyprenyl synthetase family protein n=1 Tax=Streptomyces sp. NPDC053755 TaxID=3155815 RepID=UPI003448B7AF